MDLLKKKILICCGSGGVGKTTIAASLALEAAERGKKAIVLTIDPARRLARALGLEELPNEPRLVREFGGGSLYAMMLDTKRTFDRLAEKYAPERAGAILNNRLYRHLSSMIAGSQEYMAMERLFEIDQQGEFDLLVLDTPPTRHALDFLEAPRRMIQITSNSILGWFLKPGLFAGRLGFKTLQRGAEKILGVFDRLAGFSFLHELAEMLGLISGMLGGFRARAEAVQELLRQPYVGFLLVTSPASVALQDALYFFRRIQEAKLPFLGFIINKTHAPFAVPVPETTFRDFTPPLQAKLKRNFENYHRLGERDRKEVQLLKGVAGSRYLYLPIPALPDDPHDLEGLKKLNEFIFSSGSS